MARVPELGELVANRYRIQALAREGPGYLTLHAFDRDVEVEVSLLWFRPGLFPSDEARREFLGDAVTIRGLAHPHLRRVYDAHVVRDAVFATAQVGSAANMSKRLGSKRPADEIDIIRYATSIGEGLAAAHRLGQLHGYLVPSDIVEVANQIKVTGVGLYRAASADVARDLFWTRRRYIAPEVLDGAQPTPQSDVYSMAAVLAEIASGVSGDEIGEAIEALAASHFRVKDVLGRALHADPDRRQQGAPAVLAELRRQLVDDRVPTAELVAVSPEPDTSPEIVLEAEEPPQSAHRRPTTERPVVMAELAESAEASPDAVDFDPHPISLVSADGDPMSFDGGDEEPTLAAHSEIGEMTTQYRVSAPLPAIAPRRLPTEPVEKTAPPGPPPEPPSRPPPVSARADLSPEVFEVDMSPTTLLGTGLTPPPPGAPAPGSPQFVSYKPEDRSGEVAPKTPMMPAVDRPDLQPRLRPLSSVASGGPAMAPAGSLGTYAPPRSSSSPTSPRARRSKMAFWLWLTAAALAILLGGLVAVVLVRSKNAKTAAAAADAAPMVAVVDAAPPPPDAPSGPCEKAMVEVALGEGEGDASFCIDRYEAPSRGAMPTVEVTIEEARTACSARGARLCSSEEWVEACRGKDGARYPYGPSFQREACNSSISTKREIETGGSYPECESAAGAFDMSGNVGEWVEEGFVHGGSAHDRSGGRCSRRWRGRPDKKYKDVGYRCCANPRGSRSEADPPSSP